MKPFPFIGYSLVLIAIILNLMALNDKVEQSEAKTDALFRVAERQNDITKHIIEDLYAIYDLKGSQE